MVTRSERPWLYTSAKLVKASKARADVTRVSYHKPLRVLDLL